MNKIIDILGIPYKIIECKDNFDMDCHFGMIDYKKCEIRINEDMTEELKIQTVIHEVLHGIMVNLGYNEQAQDEVFIQSLASAIYQSFTPKITTDFED